MFFFFLIYKTQKNDNQNERFMLSIFGSLCFLCVYYVCVVLLNVLHTIVENYILLFWWCLYVVCMCVCVCVCVLWKKKPWGRCGRRSSQKTQNFDWLDWKGGCVYVCVCVCLFVFSISPDQLTISYRRTFFFFGHEKKKKKKKNEKIDSSEGENMLGGSEPPKVLWYLLLSFPFCFRCFVFVFLGEGGRRGSDGCSLCFLAVGSQTRLFHISKII